MTPDKDKVWTSKELNICAEKQKIVNAEYRTAVNHQLEEWVKGNSIHNTLSPINAIVDDDDKIVGYIQCEGGECCPDFSCCMGVGWPIEQRQKFLEFYYNGNESACHAMLMGSLTGLTSGAVQGVYIAAQIPEKIH